jgi:hypothetical protein
VTSSELSAINALLQQVEDPSIWNSKASRVAALGAFSILRLSHPVGGCWSPRYYLAFFKLRSMQI